MEDRLTLNQRRVAVVWIAGLCLLLAQKNLFAQGLQVVHPSKFAVSAQQSSTEDQGSEPGEHELPVHPTPPKQNGQGQNQNQNQNQDSVLQNSNGPKSSHSNGQKFPGIGANGYAPSDSNMAIGTNNIVEIVNVRWAVYDRSGNIAAGWPKTLGSIWSAMGGICTSNGGDPIAQYDKQADRWLLSQIGMSGSSFAECVAISTTGDPTGSYYLYEFDYGTTLNDYPKWSVWPTASNSAYLFTANLFSGGQSFIGAQLCAYDRAKMLAGSALAAGVCFTIPNDGSYLPADLDGSTPPPDGTPAYFMTFETLSSWRTYTIAPNFASSTGTLSQVIPDINVPSFNEACNGGTCIPQSGTAEQLDSLGDRPMYRLAFRNFGDHEAIVATHSVATSGTSGSGVRWYEFRMTPPSASGAFSLYQAGTFAPDSAYRWMGSIAMDQNGDIGLAYSASSSSIHPAIRHTGRLPTDQLGTMEAEGSLLEGPGSQTNGLSRWGDYSDIRIDPTDDCTFWYVNQYLPNNGTFNWTTFVGSFKFPSCGAPPVPDYTVSANPGSLIAVQGGPQQDSTISVTSINGFNSAVGLSVGGCPTNATCSLDSGSLTPPANGTATTTLRVTATTSVAPGTYTLTITGTSSGAGPHSTTVSLTVTAPTPNFSLSPSVPSITITRGNFGSLTVTAKSTGANTSVSLSPSGNPPRTSVSFSPNPVIATSSGGNSIITISTNRRAPAGTFTVTITGTNGTFTNTTTFSLTLR